MVLNASKSTLQRSAIRTWPNLKHQDSQEVEIISKQLMYLISAQIVQTILKQNYFWIYMPKIAIVRKHSLNPMLQNTQKKFTSPAHTYNKATEALLNKVSINYILF